MTIELPAIEYIRDDDVGDEDDRSLRALLSACFTGPDDHVFRHQRYFLDRPQHRWLMRADDRRIIAHLAVHHKVIGAGDDDLAIGGVAEVCTRQDHRRSGYAKDLLAAAHDWMRDHEIPFAMLFGAAKHYQSSGYRNIDNPIRYWDWKRNEWIIESLKYIMVRPLTEQLWPDGTIDLRGPCF